jgi:hypothetical protein
MEKLNLNSIKEEEEELNVSPNKELNLQRRRSSLKEEFTKIKEIKQIDDGEELPAEVIAETLKNTLYNKIVGKIEVDHDYDNDNEKEN